MQPFFFNRSKESESMNQKKKLTLIAILVGCLGIVGYLAIRLMTAPVDQLQPSATPNPEVAETASSQQAQRKVDYQQWKEKNDDYVGYLYFESGLVEQPVVQSEDNEYYLNVTAEKEQSTHGAAFLDYRNSLSDQNLIIYGHYVYKDESLMFSPLHKLKEQEQYDANRRIVLELADEVREYEIAKVYYYEMGNENLEYFHPQYEDEQLQNYLNSVSEKEFYDTGVEITSQDRFLTLQTCVRNRDDLRLIIIAKQIVE